MPTPGPRRWIDPKTRDYVFETSEHVAANAIPAPGSVTWVSTGGSPTIATGQADADGGTNAVQLTDANAAGHASAACTEGGYESGTPIVGSLQMQEGGAAFAQIQLAFDSTYNVNSLVFDPRDGSIEAISGGFTSYSADLGSGWWTVRFAHPGASGSTVRLRIHPAIGTTFPTFATATTGSATVYAPSIQHVRTRTTGSPRTDQTLASSVLLALSMERGSCPLYDPEEQIGSRLYMITKATDDAVILARAYALEALRPLRARLHELEIEPSIVDVFDGSRRIGKALHVVVSWREGGRGSARRSVPYQTRIGG